MRYVVLGLIALYALFRLALLLVTGPQAFFGWNLGPDGSTIIYLTPGAPAFRAGIEAGDRIDWSALPLLGRANLSLNQAVANGSKLPVSVVHGNQHRPLTLVPTPWPPIVQVAVRLTIAAQALLMAIGITLVCLKPSRMTWGFLLGTLGVSGAGNTLASWGQSSVSHFLILNGLAAISEGASAAGFLIFISRFPSDVARGPLRMLDRFAIPLGLLVGALNLYVVVQVVAGSTPPPAWVVLFNEYLVRGLIIALALSALVVACVLTTGSDRQRIIPVLVTFAIFVATTLGGLISVSLFTDYRKSTAISVSAAIASLLLAVAVVNGIVRHRVVDVSFAISRTVVYTILTSILVGIFVLIDFVSSKVLEHFQIALVLEAAAALLFGLGLNSLHSRIDSLVDRTLFRRRHLAERRLGRTAKALSHAGDASFIDDALVIEACDALGLASAALFRPDGAAFVRVLEAGWNSADAATLTRNDRLVVNLTAELEPMHLSDVQQPGIAFPQGLRQPLVAIPLVARHELLGFVLYGGHAGGEAIDPDEQLTLTRLADAATAAYEHVASKTLLAESNALRSENAMLNKERALLRETIEALRGVAHS